MILTAGALATIIAAGAMNLRANNRLIKNLAEKGYSLKKEESCQFKRAVHDIDWLNLIPVLNLFYQFGHSGRKARDQSVIFADLATHGALERIDETKNQVLKATAPKKRGKTVMKWRIREALGLDPITERDKKKITGADRATKVRAAGRAVFLEPGKNWGRTRTQRREDRIKSLLAGADEDTLKMLDELLAKDKSTGKSKGGK